MWHRKHPKASRKRSRISPEIHRPEAIVESKTIDIPDAGTFNKSFLSFSGWYRRFRTLMSSLMNPGCIDHVFESQGPVPGIRVIPGQKVLIVKKGYLRGSGLGREDNVDTVVYIRKPCRKQMRFITEEVIKGRFFGRIFGLPGSGKSITTYIMAGTLVDSWTTLWVNVGSVGNNPEPEFSCIILSNSSKRFGKLSVQCLVKFLESASAFSNGQQLLVLDGLFESPSLFDIHQSSIVWWGADKMNRRLIHVASMARAAKVKLHMHARMGIKDFRLFSWSLKDYFDAVKHEGFAKSVEVMFDSDPNHPSRSFKSRIRSKYFYAGGCARFMFQMPTSLVQKQIREAIHSVDDLNKQININGGIYSAGLSHQLVGNVNDRARGIISCYAEIQIAQILGSDYIRSLAANPLFKGQPSVNGCFLELFFFSRAQTGHIPLWDCCDGRKVDWFCERSVSIFDPNYPSQLSCGKRVWLKPQKWNQPGYDAVFLYDGRKNIITKEAVIRFVQITRGKSHDLKLGHFAHLVHQLKNHSVFEATHVEIFFIVPSEIAHSFKISGITSPTALVKFGWPSHPDQIKEKIRILGIDF